MELRERLNGAAAESVIRSASELIEIDYTLGNLPLTMPRYELVLRTWEERIPPDSPELFELRQRLARGHDRLGDWSQASALS